jgi:Fibrinogen beta and gamma chains, C-terminal globular domain
MLSQGYWIGLENLHQLTSANQYKLRIEIQMMSNKSWSSIEYWQFSVDDQSTAYTLHVSGCVLCL